ncbi:MULTISPECIES: metal-dependent hydrolase [unclassified Sedimentibacter]|uniref:metal-dependent hydrolase n=1 Tax=unclassified Sedimentibacter TaxID=2649220 RepID=UPI0027DEE960|nr:metal-dependent hydrolase [Sedimentibacter sp. MB35-C1]WMJ78206.1 metal-dependent hydrolase [Sedimentibacter sp. MB35-C1]
MKLTYLGHSAVILEEGAFKGIIDPFITGNGLVKTKISELPDITHIFVTHGHSDHIGDTVEIAERTDALIIANHEISTYFNKFNLRTHSMHIGGRKKFDFGTVKMINALHGSGILENGNMVCGGNPCGFIIEVNGNKVYHAGDTGLTLDMKLLEDEHIDVAFIPIGGNYTMDIDDAVKASDFIKAKKVVPIHYNTFDVINADPKKYKNIVKSSEVVILDINESVDI